MGILAKNAEFHIETENFRFSANTCRAHRKIFGSQKFSEKLKPMLFMESLRIISTDTLYGLKIFFILKISIKFTNFSNKIFVIFSNKWPSKNFRQPKFFRNQLKPTFLPKSLMIYGTDTLYGLKIFFILKISTKFTNFSNKIFVIFSNKWPSKNFRQPKIFRNQMKPTFLPKSLRIYGTDTLYGVKIGIKVENFRNFAKFSKNFTLFPLITPQRKKFSKNFFGQNVA